MASRGRIPYWRIAKRSPPGGFDVADALAFVEDLNAADGQPRLDLGAGEATGDGVIVGVDIDVMVDAEAPASNSLWRR